MVHNALAYALNRIDHPNGKDYEVTLTSKEGRISRYQVKPQMNGDLIRFQIAPDGTQSKTEIKATGQTIQTSADGAKVTTEMGPDLRFGMQAPVMKSLKIEVPETMTTPNLKSEVTTERWVELNVPDDPLSLKKWTEKVTINNIVILIYNY